MVFTDNINLRKKLWFVLLKPMFVHNKEGGMSVKN
jgi:hypothetical protein